MDSDGEDDSSRFSSSSGGSSDNISLTSQSCDSAYSFASSRDDSGMEWEPEDEPYIERDPPLFDLARRCAESGDWDPFLDRLRENPGEVHGGVCPNNMSLVYGGPGYLTAVARRANSGFPTVLHYIIKEASRLAASNNHRIPPVVVRAAIEACPQATSIDPIPLYTACVLIAEPITNAFRALTPDFMKALVDADPSMVMCRPIVRVYTPTLTPLHELLRCRVLRTRFDTIEQIARILLEANPQVALAEDSNGWLALNYLCDKFWEWIGDFGRLDDSVATAERTGMLSLLLTVLRCTCRVRNCSGGAASEEHIDSLLLPELLRMATEKRFFTCVNGIIDYLLHQMPELARCRDERGLYPFARMVQDRGEDGPLLLASLATANLRLLLLASPAAARTPCRDGRLPLHAVIESGFSWNVIQIILDAEPRALNARSVKTNLLPFMEAAAAGAGDDNFDEMDQFDFSYRLLRMNPMLARGLADDPPWLRTQERMRRLEQERDELKQERDELRMRVESLSRENAELRAEKEGKLAECVFS